MTGVVVCGLMIGLSGGRWDLLGGVPWLAVAVAFVLGIALAMLAAAYPARLASGISIVRAVGTE